MVFGWIRKLFMREEIDIDPRRLFKAIGQNGDLYNIAAAIRGPDTENESLKRIFTARIRYLVFGSNLVVATTREVRRVDLRLIADAVLTIHVHDCHYLEHVHNALRSLYTLGMIDRREFMFLLDLADALVYLSWSLDEDGYVEIPTIFINTMDMLVEVLNRYQDMVV